MILNDRFYDDDDDDLFRYRDIKEYVLIDCVPGKRFYSSIQWKNSL
jgi:hypothetical protein